jgi:hypothetical protein
MICVYICQYISKRRLLDHPVRGLRVDSLRRCALTYTSLWGGNLRTRACGEVRSLASHALCSLQWSIRFRSRSIVQTLECQLSPLIRRQQIFWTLSLASIPMNSGNFLFFSFPFGLSAYFVSWFISTWRSGSSCFLKSRTKHGRRCRSPYDRPRFMHSIFDKSCVFVLGTR